MIRGALLLTTGCQCRRASGAAGPSGRGMACPEHKWVRLTLSCSGRVLCGRSIHAFRPPASDDRASRRLGLLPAVAVLLAACLCGSAAFAHAFLERASPAVGSEVHASPAALTLSFTEGVEAAFSRIEITDVTGNRMEAGNPAPGDGKRVLVVPLRPLSPGVYAVEWHVTSVDTHKSQGHFSFTVVP